LNTIIFSRDRAMQLELLLTSMKKWDCIKLFRPIVTWKATNQEFRDGYLKLINDWIVESYVRFDERGYLKEDMLSFMIDELTCFFTDDDVLYTEPPRATTFAMTFSDNDFCYSMRLGENTTYCYMLDKPQNKNEGDFAYPFSIDGSIYHTSQTKPMIESLQFTTPNELEDGMYRLVKDKPEYNIKYAGHSSVVGIPHNKVQTTHAANRSAGGSAAELNKLYLQGKHIIFEKMDFSNVIGCHQNIEYVIE
jgi:hypothetical protein